jgi:Glycosyltransferase family 87
VLTSFSRYRGQLSFVLFVILIGASFFWVNNLKQESRITWLNRVGARPMAYRYSDFRIVLAGVEYSRTGTDVWTSCPPCGAAAGFTYDLPFNYPRSILWLGRLTPKHWTPDDAEWIGPLIDASFLLTAAAVLLSPNFWQIVCSLILLISPPVLEGLERGNYDLVIFCLVALNLRFINRWSNGGGYVMAYLSGLLKIYPIVTVIGLIQRTKLSLLWFWATVAAEIAFIFLSLRELRAIARNTPQTAYGSYGYPTAFLFIRYHFNHSVLAQNAPNAAFPFLCLFCVLLIFFSWRYREQLFALLFTGRSIERSFFFAGAAVYSASFIMGANFNYRLIFLLFTLPHLFAMLREGDAGQKWMVRLILSMMLAAFWLPWWYANPLTVALDSGLTWMLFSFFAASCLAALYSLFGKGAGWREAAPMFGSLG